jgi:enoyl-CoA hydratase/carnithine racemase
LPVKCTNLFLGADMSNVITEIEDPLAIIRLNRPEKLNAFTFAMIDEIRSAVNRAAADDRVVGIIITGNGRLGCG